MNPKQGFDGVTDSGSLFFMSQSGDEMVATHNDFDNLIKSASNFSFSIWAKRFIPFASASGEYGGKK